MTFQIGKWKIDEGFRCVARKDKCVYRAMADGEAAAIYIYSEEEKYLREAGAWQAVALKKDLVPGILQSEKVDGKWILAVEWVFGTKYDSNFAGLNQSIKNDLVAASAVKLAELHKCTIGTQALDFGGRKMHESTATDWNHYISGRASDWLKILEGRGVIDRKCKLAMLTKIAKECPALPRRNCVITHCDFTLRNVIFQNDGSAKILDFGAASLGDPLYDLAKMGWRDLGGCRSPSALEFVRNYERATNACVDMELLGIYCLVQSVAALAWSTFHTEETEESDFARLAESQMWKCLDEIVL